MGSENNEVQKCLAKIDELHEIIKRKDKELEEMREHQLFLETEHSYKGKRKRIDSDDSVDNTKETIDKDQHIQDLLLKNTSLETEIEVLKVRLGISKKAASTSSKNETNKNDGITDMGTGQIVKIIENKFDAMQEKVTKLIDEKFKSLPEPKIQTMTGPTPASYSSAVGENNNAHIINLRNIMTATRNEELAEEQAKKKRANNLIIHGRKEFSPSEDNTYIKEMMHALDNPGMPKTIERVGQRNKNKIRPIRIVFNTSDIKEKVYDSLFKLKGNPLFKGIHITYDYTYNERKLIKDFSEKARQKTDQEVDASYIWRVRGSPKNGLFLKKFPRSTISTQNQ